MITDYHEGKIIHRARPITNGDSFNKKSDLSYVPKEKNTVYKRASTPKQTMFYGAVLQEELKNDLIDNTRITGAFEVCKFLRHPKEHTSGSQTVFFGKWMVKESISLVTLFFTRWRNAKNSWIQSISKEYFNQLQKYSSDEQKKYKTAMNYLAYEFSIPYSDSDDYNYLVTAIFTELILEQNFDGVLYPSVRTISHGLNVAIKPETVDEKMELVAIIECEVKKQQNKVVIHNKKFCEVSQSDTEFVLRQINT
jgi:hypothetical protein